MTSSRRITTVLVWLTLLSNAAEAKTKPNLVAGTWRMLSAQIDPKGKNRPACAPKSNSLLVFGTDMRYIEVLTDSTIPKFASDERGKGTPEENARAMAGSIAFFGTYTVDKAGVFSGNRVEGSTFPNWIGDKSTTKELPMVVAGDRMTENFQRPDGTNIVIKWQRVR